MRIEGLETILPIKMSLTIFSDFNSIDLIVDNCLFRFFFKGDSMKMRIVLLLLCTLFWNTALAESGKQFPPWSEDLYAEVKRRIDEKQGGDRGAAASARLRDMWQLITVHLNAPIEQKLEVVNDEMNTLAWIADSDLWKKEDYWATPFETITTFGGDCEDIAIAKYTMLRLMGVPQNHMGFAHVLTSKGEHHMVLLFKNDKMDHSLILDNQIPAIKSAKERPDLIAVYAFQESADKKDQTKVYVIKDKGGANRSLMGTKENQKLKKWIGVKKRARENTQSLIPFNDGRPLVPDWVEPPNS